MYTADLHQFTWFQHPTRLVAFKSCAKTHFCDFRLCTSNFLCGMKEIIVPTARLLSHQAGSPPKVLSHLPRSTSFVNVCINLQLCQYLVTSKEREGRNTSDLSLALLIAQHLAMASSSLLHPWLPVSIAATFLLWWVCCWTCCPFELFLPLLSLFRLHLASLWMQPYVKLGSPGR